MSEWKKLHPVVVNPEGNVYTVQQELRDLSSGQYETVLLSKNTYGWSEPSIAHMFDIRKYLSPLKHIVDLQVYERDTGLQGKVYYNIILIISFVLRA
jgi:hypothetical protein